MKKFSLITIIIFLTSVRISGQSAFNNNPNNGAINLSLPKTPESQSFEKYGDIPVNESTGTVEVSFPLLTVEGKKLSVPVTLSYRASGIKVSQESTWVGLGFDLICGGRITVETKGNIDDNIKKSITNQTIFKNGLKDLFARWGTYSNTSLMGYGFTDMASIIGASDSTKLIGYGWMGGTVNVPIYTPYFVYTPDTTFIANLQTESTLYSGIGCAISLSHPCSKLWDNYLTLANAAWFGAAEPDIYHAVFLGKNIDFYIDLITDQVVIIGEKKTYDVIINRNSNNWIESFVITDDDGNQYTFSIKETTKQAATSQYVQNSFNISTTAWLLTKIKSPFGESIIFNYSNFGKTYPVFDWNASISYASNDPEINHSTVDIFKPEQSPYYLTSIESDNAKLVFNLSSRSDLRGDGARKLDNLSLYYKNRSTPVKQIKFNYSYFSGYNGQGNQYVSSSEAEYYSKRLKLLSFQFLGETQTPTHSFFYNESSVPGKLSYDQDHWGYYNAVGNYGISGSPHALIPTFYSLRGVSSMGEATNAAISPKFGEYTTISTFPMTGFDGYGNRNCSDWACKSMMLDSIVYPTGGSTKLEYEPHVSSYYQTSDFKGGGLRIKSIKTYKNKNILSSYIDYDYRHDLEYSGDTKSSGIYLGYINYLRIDNKVYFSNNWTEGNTSNISLVSNGNLNTDNINVGYTKVRINYYNPNTMKMNGYIVKYFNYKKPVQHKYTNRTFPFSEQDDNFENGIFLLNKDYYGIAPTPDEKLEGKLMKEIVYNNNDKIVKATDYYYSQPNYMQKLYSMQAFDRYPGFVNSLTTPGKCSIGLNYVLGYSRWGIVMSPATSYNTITDSIITKTYDITSNSYVKNKVSFKYNSYFQPQYEINENSDGVKSIIYTKRARDFTNWAGSTSGPLVGDGLELSKILIAHMIDIPVERLIMTKRTDSDTIVTSGIYYKFKNKQISSILNTNLNQGKKINQYFNPSFINTSKDITIDPSYSLNTKIDYDKFNQVIQTQDKTGLNTSYLWGYNNQYIVAQITGSDSTTIKSKISQQTLDNPDSDTALQTELNKLRTISGAQATTYTYSPFIGVTSITDSRGIKNTFEYDNLGRLITSKDNSNSLIGKYIYNYQTSPNDGLEGFTSISALLSCGTPDVIVDSVGVATVSVTGGSGDFTYNWYLYDPLENLISSALSTTNSFFNFTSHIMGTNVIKCMVTDNKTGQTKTVTKLIKIRSLLIITMTTQLYSSSAGRSQVSVSGGSGTYSYSWYLKDHSDNILSKFENTSQNYWYFGTTYKGPITVSCYVYDTLKKVYGIAYYDFTAY